MLSEDRLYWIWLADRCGAASKEFGRLMARFEDPYEIYRLEPEEIDALGCIGERLCDRLCQKSLENAYKILKFCDKNGVEIIAYGDKKYPSRLKTLEDPPVLLYCMGEFPDFDELLCVGIVGTRKISAYGMQSAYKISYELASANCCIVSGMALGVDAVAACAALEAGGRTVAVLGCGIDIVYPKPHAKLKRCIIGGGCVITEYPPAEPPYGSNFPKRNRIISGLCQGVLVVEGNIRSGALITARKAIEQGRQVFALPGKINESNAEGPNELIQDGVNVVLSSEDIANHFYFLYGSAIYYDMLSRSKHRSDLDLSVLEKRGVSCEVHFGGWEIQGKEKKKERSAADSVCSEKASAPITSVKHDDTPVTEKESAETETERKRADNSSAVLESLDVLTRKVFDAMPLDRAVSADEFVAQGIGISEAVTSLTVLEIMGLVSSLPGGTYIRK